MLGHAKKVKRGGEGEEELCRSHTVISELPLNRRESQISGGFSVFWPSTVTSFESPHPARYLWSETRAGRKIRRQMLVTICVWGAPQPSSHHCPPIPAPKRTHPSPKKKQSQPLGNWGYTLGERGDQMRQTHLKELIYRFAVYWIPCE